MALIRLEKMVIEEENKIINARTVVVNSQSSYSSWGYSQLVKEECLTMYLNGNGFRAIERIKKVNHNTVIRWVKQAANQLPNNNNNHRQPQVGQLDELQTFIGKKK